MTILSDDHWQLRSTLSSPRFRSRTVEGFRIDVSVIRKKVFLNIVERNTISRVEREIRTLYKFCSPDTHTGLEVKTLRFNLQIKSLIRDLKTRLYLFWLVYKYSSVGLNISRQKCDLKFEEVFCSVTKYIRLIQKYKLQKSFIV